MKTERSNHELGPENSPENSRTEEETSARQLEPHKNRFTSFVEQLGDGDICSLFKEIYLGMWNRWWESEREQASRWKETEVR